MIHAADIIKKRKELKLSRADFAAKCGLTAGKLWRIETKDEFKPGEREAITLAYFATLPPAEYHTFSLVDGGTLTVAPLPDIDDPATLKDWPDPATESLPPSKYAAVDVGTIDLQTVTEGFTSSFVKAIKNLNETLAEFTQVPPLAQKPTFNYDTTRYISHSEIATFQDCRRKWWLGWHRGLRPAVENPVGALAMGTRIHKVLEFYYPVNETYKVDPRDMLENLIMKDWTTLTNNYFADGGKTVPPEVKKKFDTEAKMQRVMIEGYLEWEASTGENAYYKTLAPEKFIEVPTSGWWDGRNMKLVGRVDRLVQRLTDGAVLFEDFKTAASIPQLMKVLPINTQMKHYHMLMAGDPSADYEPPLGALYTVLRKSMQTQTATPPFYARVEVYHNAHEAKNYENKVEAEVMRIERAEASLDKGGDHHRVVPPRPSNDCSWKCPFFSICPMFDDGSAVESMIENNFVSGKPLDYYDPMKKDAE